MSKIAETQEEEPTRAEEKKKTCFVITPIGEKNSDTRRHINGVIQLAIKPALGVNYNVIAAHEINEPGNVTKQIVTLIVKRQINLLKSIRLFLPDIADIK